MRVLVADDEGPARRVLVRMLEQLGGISVVGEADNGLSTLEEVGRTRPDTLLLDIEMPELGGLELAARHVHLPPVIFVTAHEEHAVRAFEVHAVDYLLKPVRRERLAQALERARAHLGARVGTPRVVTHERGTVRLFDACAIHRFRAADKYTVFCVDGHEHATDEALVALESRLRPYGFMRVRRGELIRLASIRAMTSESGLHEVLLEDGQRVRVSRRLVPTLRGALGIR